ncbi:hypothetical protein C495_14362 [Natronorubrum sulfidifaciens JCM 14089]|uniref:Uncharacterized protein n=1 Tax=Natronorubrum sulfidifaciens JCM 14089 TaxID=1230460 RepID=L9VZN8_9EURY|nr:hypothetical protein C495_14362 [Natronorubrum sulfidifaciens JCM 14089]
MARTTGVHLRCRRWSSTLLRDDHRQVGSGFLPSSIELSSPVRVSSYDHSFECTIAMNSAFSAFLERQ